jgi:hypothetical protein
MIRSEERRQMGAYRCMGEKINSFEMMGESPERKKRFLKPCYYIRVYGRITLKLTYKFMVLGFD